MRDARMSNRVLAQAVGRGACGIAGNAGDTARTEISGDDAHQYPASEVL